MAIYFNCAPLQVDAFLVTVPFEFLGSKTMSNDV